MDREKKIDNLVETVDTLVGTVESLAIMVKEGFERVTTKDDLRIINEGLDLVRADVSDIKTTQKPLERTQNVQEDEINELKIRVDKIEDKVFAI